LERLGVKVVRGPAVGQRGSSDGLAQALEFVVAPLLLGLLGWYLDRRFGTGSVFTVTLSLFGIIGVGVTQYFRYVQQIERANEGKPWIQRRP
jgi:F0F1-type ATP synthase assembly protein I